MPSQPVFTAFLAVLWALTAAAGRALQSDLSLSEAQASLLASTTVPEGLHVHKAVPATQCHIVKGTHLCKQTSVVHQASALIQALSVYLREIKGRANCLQAWL